MIKLDKKIKIATVQFYISHTCNLACPGCLSFNNFAISGHELWKDNIETSKKWAQIIEPTDLTVIGGEPLTNPDVDNWVKGLREFFPTVKDYKICTNGLLIKKFKKEIRNWWDLGVVLEISAHTKTQLETILQDLDNLFQDQGMQVERYSKEKLVDMPSYYVTEYEIIFLWKNAPIVIISFEYQFYEWGARKISRDTVYLYNSAPAEAHAACDIYDCHYIYKGELYKCGTLVGAKELLKKYNLDHNSKKLIEEYAPINLEDTQLQEKIQTLTDTPLKQCAICPTKEKDQSRQILDSDYKKINFAKK